MEKPRDRYSLRWNNYINNMGQVFDEHLQTEKLVDVTLTCEGQFIKAHKLILSASSEYFREMFDKLDTTSHPIIVFHNTKMTNLKYLVNFIYHGEIKVLDTEIQDLLMLGDSLRVKGLSSLKMKKPDETGPPPSSHGSMITSNSPSKPQENESKIQPPPLIKFIDKDTNTTTTSSFKILTGLDVPKLVLAPGFPVTLAGTLKPVNLTAPPRPVSQPASFAKSTPSQTVPTEKTIQVNSSTSNASNQTSDNISSASSLSVLKPMSERIKTMKLLGLGGRSLLKRSLTQLQSIPQVPSSNTSNTSDSSPPRTVRIRDFALETPDDQEPKKKLSRSSSSESSSLADPKESETRNQKKTRAALLSKIQRHSTSPIASEIKENVGTNIKETNTETSGTSGEPLARPPNAFMMFANEWRKKLSIEYPNENSREINYRLGNMWKAMSVETKNTYYQAAQDAAEEYKLKCAKAKQHPTAAAVQTSTLKSPVVVDALQLVKLVMNSKEVDDSQHDDISEQTLYIKEEEPDIENHEVEEGSSDMSYKGAGD